MTVQEVKEILCEARTAGFRYFKARDRYRDFERRLLNGKAVRYNSTGAECEHNGNAVENAYCELSDREADAEKCREALSKPYCAAGRLIYLVENGRERQVLNMRYLYCKSWEQIAAELNVSVRYIHKLHGTALEKISRKT